MNTSKQCARCLDSAEWKDGELRCNKCGQLIAVRYRIGEEVYVYPFEKFKSNKKRIEGREDTYKITKSGDLLGDISFKGFEDEIRDYVRSESADLFSVQGDGNRICEDCESEDSERLQQTDNLDNDTYYKQ